jgi:hypothetical protein
MRERCPRIDCQSNYGHFSEITKNILLREKIPAEILNRVRAEDPIARCTYCGFTWAETANMVVPFGVLDSDDLDNFHPVPANHPLRRD